jgi:hypothetical protein
MSTLKIFATVISYRLADEWDGASEFPEDAILLRKVLEKLLTENPGEIPREKFRGHNTKLLTTCVNHDIIYVWPA